MTGKSNEDASSYPGDVGRCPGVTSIKDGLPPSTDGGGGGPEMHYTSLLRV